MAASAWRDMWKQQLNSITQCPVCRDTYKDPRSLPCVHTFCLECVQGFSKYNQPGDSVACPMCRREFAIPDNGINGLPKNFFIQQFQEASDASNSHCEGCCDTETPVNKMKQAVKYCVDCQQKCCEDCVDTHKRMNLLRGHKIVEIDDKEAFVKPTIICCTKHAEEALKLYCFDCQAAICFMCFAEMHKSCKCSDVNKVVDEFRNQMADDIGKMTEIVDTFRLMLSGQEENKKVFVSKIDKIEKEICDQVEYLKAAIDSEKERLLQHLAEQKIDRVKKCNVLSMT